MYINNLLFDPGWGGESRFSVLSGLRKGSAGLNIVTNEMNSLKNVPSHVSSLNIATNKMTSLETVTNHIKLI